MSKRIINVKEQTYLKTGNIHAKFGKHRFTSISIYRYIYIWISTSNSLLWYPLKKQSTLEKCWVPTCFRTLGLITWDLRSSHCASCKKNFWKTTHWDEHVTYCHTLDGVLYIGTHPVQLSTSITSPPWLKTRWKKKQQSREVQHLFCGSCTWKDGGWIILFLFFSQI